MKPCPVCKKEIHDDAMLCKHCKSVFAAVPETTEATEKEKRNLSGIGGWLLLPALAIVITPASFVSKNLEVFATARNFGGSVVVNCPAMMVSITILSCLALVAYLFFKKKAVAPVCFILYILTSFLLWTVHDTFAAQCKAPVIANLFTSFVLIPYFVFSNRVKLTFTNALDDAVWADRLVSRTTPFLNAFNAFLWKTRKFLLLEILLFAVLNIVMQSLFRAVFVLKDISEFRQLLF